MIILIDSVDKWNNTFKDEEIAQNKYVLTKSLVFNEQPQIPRLTGCFNGKCNTLTFNYLNHKGFFRLDGGLISCVIVKPGQNGNIKEYQGGLTNAIQWDGQEKPPEETINNVSIVKNCKFLGNLNVKGSAGLMANAYLTVYKDLRILGCKMEGTISGENTVGICGNYGGSLGKLTVKDCYFKGNISGFQCAGIIGSFSGTSGKLNVYNCHGIGDILGNGESDNDCGGILGTNIGNDGESIIEKCSFKGNISGNKNAGLISGLAGKGGRITVKQCYGEGKVLSKNISEVGASGLVGIQFGQNGLGIIDECWYIGDISGNTTAGVAGTFFGYFGSGIIKNSWFKGKVSGNFTGGLVGQSAGQNCTTILIQNCHAEAEISNDNPEQSSFGNVGGLIAPQIAQSNGVAIVENCNFKGKISGFNAAGIIGPNAAVEGGNLIVRNCKCNATLDGVNLGGIMGLSPSLDNGNTKIYDCDFNGKIIGENNGGIIANQSLNQNLPGGITNIENCNSNSCITAINSGGIIGSNSVALIQNCNVSGCISGDGSGSICGADCNIIKGNTSQICFVNNCKINTKVCGQKVGGVFGSNANNPIAQNICLTGIYKNNNGAVIQSGKVTLTGEVKAPKQSQAAGNGEVVNENFFYNN